MAQLGEEGPRKDSPWQLEGSWLLPSAPGIEGLGFQPQQLNTMFPLPSEPQREALSCQQCWAVWPAFFSKPHESGKKKKTQITSFSILPWNEVRDGRDEGCFSLPPERTLALGRGWITAVEGNA